MKSGERRPGDGIYLAILYVLVGSVIFGAAVALVGGSVYQNEAMKTTGTGIVIVCGALYFVFRWLGRREMSKRRDRTRRGDSDGSGDDG